MGMRFETRQRQASRLAQPPEVLCLDDRLATGVLCNYYYGLLYCVLCTLAVERIPNMRVVFCPIVVFSSTQFLRAYRRSLERKRKYDSSGIEVLLLRVKGTRS